MVTEIICARLTQGAVQRHQQQQQHLALHGEEQTMLRE